MNYARARRSLMCLVAAGAAVALSFSVTADNSTATVTFNKDVAPIIFENCASCHRPGETAPMAFLSYKEVRPWAKSIREKVVERDRKSVV